MKTKVEYFMNKITDFGGYTFSEGTHDTACLLAKAYDLLNGLEFSDEVEYIPWRIARFSNQVEKALSWDRDEYDSAFEAYYWGALQVVDEEQASYLLDDAFDILGSLSPEGYYFGSHEGDGACFGWWKYQEE